MLAYNLSQEDYSYDDGCDADNNGQPDSGCNISQAIVDGIENSPWIKSSVSGSLIYNTIDDVKNPHSGIYGNFTTEIAGLGGDAEFVKVTGRATYYQTLVEEMDVIGLLTAGGGYVAGFGNEANTNGGLRVFDMFMNNDRMIRGFEYGGIGPVDTTTGDHLGGTTYFNASAETQFPIPVIPESFGLRGALFADAATLYGNDFPEADASVGSEWRVSLGAGLIWASPFGPLRVDYAVPVVKQDTDDVQNFNFGISTRF